MLRVCQVMMLLALGCGGAWAIGAGDEYDPKWTVGDRWSVRFTYSAEVVSVSARADIPPQVVQKSRLYDYRVDYIGQVAPSDLPRLEIDPKTIVVKIMVSPREFGAESLQLVFDKQSRALLGVDEVIKSGADGAGKNAEKLTTVTPFPVDSWLSKPQQFGRTIQDMPVFPDKSEGRTVVCAGSPTLSFVQKTAYGENEVVITMTRKDAPSGGEQKTEVKWKKGAKWWSEATVSIGGSVTLTGTMER